MLIEQAFYNLPEILVGAGYARQDYEAGIVSAFSLAVLQELNGRNAPNPLSFLCAEKRFSDDIEKLRADLHVRLADLYVGSRDYSEFGFRFSNWVEAKFFRSGAGTPPSTQNLGAVVADVVRLIALVPLEKAKDKHGNDTDRTVTGRYFLHVYYGDPLEHLNPRRKSPKPGQAAQRKWVKRLLHPGRTKITSLDIQNESDTFYTHLGKGLATATCALDVTNLVIAPRSPANKTFYTFVLTRIDEASIAFNGRTFKFTADRKYACTPANEFVALQKDVAANLKAKKKSEVAPVGAEDE